MGLLSPSGLMRALTTLVDRSLDGQDAALSDDRRQPRTKRPRAKRGGPELELFGRDHGTVRDDEG